MVAHTEQDWSDSRRQPRRFARQSLAIALCLLLFIVAGGAPIKAAGEPAADPSIVPQQPASSAAPQTLDLKMYYNTPAKRFANGRFPWGAVPRDAKTFGNVPLAIDGMICLWGEQNSKYGVEFRKEVEDIVVDRKFETLYVYHCAFFRAPEGTPVYRLTMHYADDSVRETTLCYGLHLLDWLEYPNLGINDLGDPKSKVVWREDFPNRKPTDATKLRFTITSIPNPKPTVEVKSISLVSAQQISAGCILAMTTGPANLLKVEAEGKAEKTAAK